MKIKTITFTFENCDQITIEGKYIGEFLVSDIHTSIERIACNAIEKIDRADVISIEIHSDANKERYPFDQTQLQKETVFERLNKWKDITAIEIKMVGDMDEDSETERYYYWVDWVGDDDIHNPAQSTYISELGHLYLVIAEGKGIEDFFNYEYINDARCVDHGFAMCDVGDKYSKKAEELEKVCKEREEQTV